MLTRVEALRARHIQIMLLAFEYFIVRVLRFHAEAITRQLLKTLASKSFELLVHDAYLVGAVATYRPLERATQFRMVIHSCVVVNDIADRRRNVSKHARTGPRRIFLAAIHLVHATL